jgi:hypothetical protein
MPLLAAPLMNEISLFQGSKSPLIVRFHGKRASPIAYAFEVAFFESV